MIQTVAASGCRERDPASGSTGRDPKHGAAEALRPCQASISVASTVKCSSDSTWCSRACVRTRAKNAVAMSQAITGLAVRQAKPAPMRGVMTSETGQLSPPCDHEEPKCDNETGQDPCDVPVPSCHAKGSGRVFASMMSIACTHRRKKWHAHTPPLTRAKINKHDHI